MSKKHFGQDAKGETDDRLLQLFWNRAALKKEFRRLREQRYRLEETLKQQQAATQSAEARMKALERLFANPEVGFNAIVYYQLRNVWNTCAAELQKFASELLRQREQKEVRQLMMEFNRDRNQRLADLAGEMHDLETKIAGLRASIKKLHAELETSRGIFGYFKRRPLQTQMGTARASLAVLKQQYDELNERQSSIAAQHPPEFPGVGVQGKRITNLGVIALAQHMLVYYTQKGYAGMARDAVTVPIEEVRYGTREQCTRLMEEIPRAMKGLKSDPGFSTALNRGAKALYAVANYLTEEDTIPRAESLDLAAKSRAPTASIPVNVLAQDFWDIYSALVR